MNKRRIGKPDFCQNYPELNKAFEEELQSLCHEEDEQTVNIRKSFENFKPFLTKAIYGTTECVDPRVRVYAQEGWGFGTENWRFCHKTILESAFEYARDKLSVSEYNDIIEMRKTDLGITLIDEHCCGKLKEFYGFEFKTYWSEFYKYFIRDMNLIQEMWFYSFANVAGWYTWLPIKLIVGIPWATVMFALVFIISGLERIYNFLFKK